MKDLLSNVYNVSVFQDEKLWKLAAQQHDSS